MIMRNIFCLHVLVQCQMYGIYGMITGRCILPADLLVLFHFQTIQVGSEYQAIVPEGLCAYTSLHSMYIWCMCVYILYCIFLYCIYVLYFRCCDDEKC